jgi:hypothetical protein
LTTRPCPQCGAAPGERQRRGDGAVRVTAGIRLGLWLLALAYCVLVCGGFFLARFGDMDPDADARHAAAATTALVYLAGPLAITLALDRCLAAVADLLRRPA